jgi:hypothetical protein
MKRTFLLAGFTTVAIALALGVSWSAWRRTRDAAPALVVPARIELGERELGETAVGAVLIENRGTAQLLIEDVQTSCSCAGLEVHDGKRFVRVRSLTVPARGQTKCQVRVLVQGSAGGKQVSTITFRTNDPASPVANVDACVSNVKAGVSSIPTVVLFGRLSPGASSSQEIDIYDRALESRRIERVSASSPQRFEVELLPLSRDAALAGDELHGTLIGRVRVTPLTEVPGSLNGDIHVHLAGHSKVPTAIPVAGEVVGPIKAIPSTVYLPRMSAAGPTYAATVRLRSTDSRPFRVRLAGQQEALDISVRAGEGCEPEHLIDLKARLSEQAKPQSPGKYDVDFAAQFSDDPQAARVSVVCFVKD